MPQDVIFRVRRHGFLPSHLCGASTQHAYCDHVEGKLRIEAICLASSDALLTRTKFLFSTQTFDDVWEQQENNHQMNVVQLTMTWHHESVAPPPLSLLALSRALLVQATKAIGQIVRFAARRGSLRVRLMSERFVPLFELGSDDDIAPGESDSWQEENSDENLLSAIDEFLEDHANERTLNWKWGSSLMKEVKVQGEELKHLLKIFESRGSQWAGAPAPAPSDTPPAVRKSERPSAVRKSERRSRATHAGSEALEM